MVFTVTFAWKKSNKWWLNPTLRTFVIVTLIDWFLTKTITSGTVNSEFLLRWKYKTRSIVTCNFESQFSYSNFCFSLFNFSDALLGRQQICIRHTSTFVSLFGSFFTDTKAVTKRISSQPHRLTSVVGLAGSWKTRLIGRMIVNQEKIFPPCCDTTIYFYKYYQQYYGTILMDCQSKHIDIEFIQGLEGNFFLKSWSAKKILLVLDDLFDEAAQSKDFLALVVSGRHRKVLVMVLRHNSFQRTKSLKKIDLNVTQIILFNGPRDSEQIGVLGRQLERRHATMDAYKRATQKRFGHLMIDLYVRSNKSLRYSLNCSGDVPSIFYCSTDQLCLHLDNEFTKLLYSWFLVWFSCYTEKMLQLELLWLNNQFFCDCIFNVVKGNVILEKNASKNRCTFRRNKHWRCSLLQKKSFNET